MPTEFNCGLLVQKISEVEPAQDRQVLTGLLNPNYDFRTIDGLSASSGLERDYVVEALRRNVDLVRSPFCRDNVGRQLFTLRDKPRNWREMWAELRYSIMGSRYWARSSLEIPELYSDRASREN